MSWAWFIARPKLSLALLLTLALVGWHFQDKISDWWDDRKIHRLEDKVTALESQVADQAKRLADAEASAQAAQAARERNDTEIPRIRSDTRTRADRAAVADDAQRVRDVQDTLSGYGSASDQL